MLPGPSGSTADMVLMVMVWQAMLTICIWNAAWWILKRLHGCVVDRNLVSRLGTLLFVGTPLMAVKLSVWMDAWPVLRKSLIEIRFKLKFCSSYDFANVQ